MMKTLLFLVAVWIVLGLAQLLIARPAGRGASRPRPALGLAVPLPAARLR